MNYGFVHKLESFGAVDGPGVRFVVFLAGCSMRCLYCHNPDAWKMESGHRMTADDVMAEALPCSCYWGKDGGITVSGGEPLLQIDFLTELFSRCHEHGINTCIDTAGGPFTDKGPWFEKFQTLMKLTDLLLVDVKHIDQEAHIRLTGQGRENICCMFRYLDKIQKPVWIRYVLVPGLTDSTDCLYRTGKFIRSLSNVKKVEVLPYHDMAVSKYRELGIEYPIPDIKPPSHEEVVRASELLTPTF